MVSRVLNWRSLFFLLALVMVAGTLIYTRYLADKIEKEERQRVAEWIVATQTLAASEEPKAIELSNLVIRNNEDIPLIATDSAGNVIDYRNLDSVKVSSQKNYLKETLENLAGENKPLEWEFSENPRQVFFVYFGKTLLQKEVQYYPIVQLFLVGLFVALLIALITTQNRSSQNQVWAGMAKETAHQLGTPLTSLQGWLEVLREQHGNDSLVVEMEKDIQRLKLVSERFGKIGSSPQLEICDLVKIAGEMIAYMKRRAPERILFSCKSDRHEVLVQASPTLIEWVLENLMKNALDAMEGKGKIEIQIHDELTQVVIDIEDSGKGITAANLGKVFTPGFTTKKRGWGLGLSLSKRIVEQYHKGQLFVKHSEPGKGTTFRMILPRG
ncbi:MAG: HAMP domain-containing histidine kinase [Chitinophagaceae bacterium]|nr:HAMP domain-containing histidine kinase [Chitinophagaceae bacterium]